MPRTSASNKQLVAKYLREFPAELFRSDGDILYCTACDKRVSCSQRSQVTQHIATGSHIENKNRKKERTSYQAFLTSPSSSKSTLSTDLCRALVRADIPFHKLKNPHFKGFLETYIGKKMPDESTLRKNYLEDIYKDTLTKIPEHIKDGPIWVSIDETADVEGRYIANAVIGKLDSDADVDSKPFLLNNEVLEKCNHSTISRFFDASMHILWPSGVLNEKVLLFLSDAAPNMVKAGQSIQVFYPKIIHVTCIAHDLHRVAETIRSLFSDVDSLISSVKKVFLKAPIRIKMLKDLYPDLCLPPEPILTRWGTWLETAQYYYEKSINSRMSFHISKTKQ
uniref:DUF659 domain-containing protein n=2 Tax=Rhodnius prolixus TaxID=13249 RepID=A0A4P6D7Y3_RHOPR